MTNSKDAVVIRSKFEGSRFGNGVTFSNEPIRTANDQQCGMACGSCSTLCVGRPSCVSTCTEGGGCGSTNKIKIYK